jgi:hypothetical protein
MANGAILPRALEIHTRARRSDEAHEAFAAFREHREPRWSYGNECRLSLRESASFRGAKGDHGGHSFFYKA